MHVPRSARWLLLSLALCLAPASSFAGVFISINFAPPVLPIYEQPICPEPNLMWTPGYWAYGDEGYYWVPGAWVPAPYEGALWTPPYWGWSSGLYVFHPGYWGYHVGYYGGVNYGYGYGGIGFAGGAWRGGFFSYNTAVMHVNETVIHNTYIDRTVVERGYVDRNSHVAFSGGRGGINHPPNAEERMYEHEQHTQPTAFQSQHMQQAQSNHMAYAKFNSGRPANLVASRPLQVESHQAPPAPHNFGNPGGPANNRPAYSTNGAPNNRPNYSTPGGRPNNLPENRTVNPGARPYSTPENRPNNSFTPRPNTPAPNYSAPHGNTEAHGNVAPRNTAPPPPPHVNSEAHGNPHPAEKPRPQHEHK